LNAVYELAFDALGGRCPYLDLACPKGMRSKVMSFCWATVPLALATACIKTPTRDLGADAHAPRGEDASPQDDGHVCCTAPDDSGLDASQPSDASTAGDALDAGDTGDAIATGDASDNGDAVWTDIWWPDSSDTVDASGVDAWSPDAGPIVSCGCGGGLFVEIIGDGPDQMLTGYDGPLPGRLSYTSVAVDPCKVPWAAITMGESAIVAQLYSCAATGQVPCIDLAYTTDGSGLTTGEYRDRQGRRFDLTVSFSQSAAYWNVHLGDVIEGTYTATLINGTTLNGRFRVCVLAIITVA
jgi:hypothetical protein